MSPDRRQGVVVIAFVGSVFSPYYYAARAHSGQADPMDFCAFNVVVYNHDKRIWGLTEWPRGQVERTGSTLVIGRNRIVREADRITISVDESTPRGTGRIRGDIVIHPTLLSDRDFPLDDEGVHRWRPLAPLSRMEVNLSNPALQFAGSAYHDANDGGAPLENTLRRWRWSRHELGDDAAVLYDVDRLDGSTSSLALRFLKDGTIDPFPPPATHGLPASRWWRCPRDTRSEGPEKPRIIRTLEDSPFYARTIIESTLLGSTAPGVHESLALDRFTAPWMQWMLPFRTRRVT